MYEWCRMIPGRVGSSYLTPSMMKVRILIHMYKFEMVIHTNRETDEGDKINVAPFP